MGDIPRDKRLLLLVIARNKNKWQEKKMRGDLLIKRDFRDRSTKCSLRMTLF